MNASCIIISKRFARKFNWKTWKNNWLPFEWNRPEAEQGYFSTGDRIEKIEKFDDNLLPKLHADALKEVKDVPNEIKNLLNYSFLNQKKNCDEFRHEKLSELLNSSLGLETLSGKIINFTLKIRKARKMLREEKNHVGLKKLINFWHHKRLKYLIELNKFDKEEYTRLLNELEVDEPTLVMGERKSNRIQRKAELRRLTKEYCDEIINKKLKDYHEKLKEEQVSFEKEKKDFEEWMTKTMKEFNIDESLCKK